jgi:hypothetical protein
MECKKDKNMNFCSCSYPGCSRKGICCECLQYHLQNKPSIAVLRRLPEHGIYSFGPNQVFFEWNQD